MRTNIETPVQNDEISTCKLFVIGIISGVVLGGVIVGLVYLISYLKSNKNNALPQTLTPAPTVISCVNPLVFFGSASCTPSVGYCPEYNSFVNITVRCSLPINLKLNTAAQLIKLPDVTWGEFVFTVLTAGYVFNNNIKTEKCLAEGYDYDKSFFANRTCSFPDHEQVFCISSNYSAHCPYPSNTQFTSNAICMKGDFLSYNNRHRECYNSTYVISTDKSNGCVISEHNESMVPILTVYDDWGICGSDGENFTWSSVGRGYPLWVEEV